MGKSLFIAEKPSVAREFGNALGENLSSKDGYMEGNSIVVTWCVGHLVLMSYPDVYDKKYVKWNLADLPFLPKEYIYEINGPTAKQFKIVSGLLNRDDIDTIYICTDSGREGEYIYRLVDQMAKVPDTKQRKRVWINSQTEEEIKRGIKEAKDWSEYDNISDSAYLRAKEDYLMGINFSRALTMKYRWSIQDFLKEDKISIAVGRVMTCVLGMVVNREREVRDFVETPFYRVIGNAAFDAGKVDMEWKAVEGSKYFDSPVLYKENGFKKEEDAKNLISELSAMGDGKIASIEKKTEKKAPPLLYNLAELQSDCTKLFKISPEETLNIVQKLYESKLVTYPRTDARVLSSAVCKEITKNIQGLANLTAMKPFVEKIMSEGLYKGLEKTKYCDDKKITDHYAIIPTGQVGSAVKTLTNTELFVYEVIVRRFLAIFLPPAIYEKITLDVALGNEHLFANEKYLKEPGYLSIMNYSFKKKKTEGEKDSDSEDDEDEDELSNAAISEIIGSIKKGDSVSIPTYEIKEGKTSPPKRYTSGSIILAMEGAGKLIEDEELRAQIKGSGIGTSATRGAIIEKLVDKNHYLAINKKTQVITPTQRGEMIYEVVKASVPSLLNPELTASWEKGLTQVAEGTIGKEVYMEKLESFVSSKTERVKAATNQNSLKGRYSYVAQYYKNSPKAASSKK